MSWPRRRCWLWPRLRQHRGGAPGPCPTLLCSPGALLGATHLAPAGSPQVPVFPPGPSSRAGSAGGMGWALVPGWELRWAGCARGPAPAAGIHRASTRTQRLPRKQVQRAPGRKGSVHINPSRCSPALATLAGQSQEENCVPSTNTSFSLLFV